MISYIHIDYCRMIICIQKDFFKMSLSNTIILYNTSHSKVRICICRGSIIATYIIMIESLSESVVIESVVIESLSESVVIESVVNESFLVH